MQRNGFGLLKGLLFAFASSRFLISCSDGVTTDLNTESASAEGGEYLPYGVPVPVGEELTLLPPPYDPETMGPPISDRTAHLNLAADRTSRYAKMPNPMWDKELARRGLAPLAVPNHHSNKGYWLYKTASYPFARAQQNHDVQRDTRVPVPMSADNPVIYYAPTLLPAGGSCIESVTIHWRFSTNPNVPEEDLHGFWNWCNPNPSFVVTKNLNDATFRNRYVRVFSGEEFLVTFVHQQASGSCWIAGFYDYVEGVYSIQYESCGVTQTGHGTKGWTMWETYNVMQNNTGPTCPSTPSIKAADIKVGTRSQPSNTPFDLYSGTFGTLNIDNPCFNNGAYTFVRPPPGFVRNTWQANTLR